MKQQAKMLGIAVIAVVVFSCAPPVRGTTVLSLDGQWLLATDPQNIGRDGKWWTAPRLDAKRTKVPWIIQDAFPGYHGVAWYWKEFEAPANPVPGGRTLLRFWQVDYKADLWLNDAAVGSHEGCESPFVFDVTDLIRPNAKNRLAVRVLNPTHQPIDGIVAAPGTRVASGIPWKCCSCRPFVSRTSSSGRTGRPARSWCS
jgi:beta-galactosidase/beta-glucuronidase